MRVSKFLGSPGFKRDDDAMRQLAGTVFDRGVHPEGTWRQLAAIYAAGDRTRRLTQIRVPTLVIHGTADRLLPPAGGKATQAAIPGAQLLLVPGMGHELPPGSWPLIIDAIVENANRDQVSDTAT